MTDKTERKKLTDEYLKDAGVPIRQRIYDFICHWGRHVSFAEINRKIPDSNGDKTLRCAEYENLYLWFELSDTALDAILGLFSEKKIELKHTGSTLGRNISMVYMIDGKHPRFPIAKRIRHYKKPRWLPVVLNPTHGERRDND